MNYDAGETVRDGYEEERDAVRAMKRPGRDRESVRDRQPVEAALDAADEAAAHVADLIEEAFRRLAPILGPEGPEPAPSEVRQSGDTSPLAERLTALGARLGASGDALARLLRRIEL